MIISCPECSGKFRIDASALGAGGRTVRCGKCGHTWLQTPPDSSADSQAGTGPGNATDPVPADAGSRGLSRMHAAVKRLRGILGRTLS